MPTLFKDNVPTFVLHGDRTVGVRTESAKPGLYEIGTIPPGGDEMAFNHSPNNLDGGDDDDRHEDRFTAAKAETERAKSWYLRDIPSNVFVEYVPCIKGVHHSKFALMISKRYVRLAISSQNLYVGRTTDCVWVSPRIAKEKKSVCGDWSSGLAHYFLSIDRALEKRGQFSSSGLPNLRSFVNHYALCSSLNRVADASTFWTQFFSSYSFRTLDSKGPWLVTAVPGQSPPMLRSLNEEDKDVLRRSHGLGHRRLGILLRYLRRERRSRKEPCSDATDAIIVQPTSIGSCIDGKYFYGEFLQSLSGNVRPKREYLVWPTKAFVLECSDSSATSRSGALWLTPDSYADLGKEGAQNSFSRYKVREPWIGTRWHRLVPHCKIYFRFLGDDGELEWILLGSMCLSKGAQGCLSCPVHDVNDACFCERANRVFRIRNFEMGVLFHARKGRRLVVSQSRWPVVRPDRVEFPIPFVVPPPLYRKDRLERHVDIPYFHDRRNYGIFVDTSSQKLMTGDAVQREWKRTDAADRNNMGGSRMETSETTGASTEFALLVKCILSAKRRNKRKRT
eukprot:g4043.t1